MTRHPLCQHSGSGLMRLYEADECGKDDYPPEWHATIKHAVRADAGERCVRCLHPYAKGAGEWSPCDDACSHIGPLGLRLPSGDIEVCAGFGDEAYALGPGHSRGQVVARWRILTVHHLDGNKANCRWWNLAALCQRCHLQIQGKVKMERVWPWEHSQWFRPYVAGYYALTYLGQELDRAAVEARLDELLSLERQVA